MQVNNSEGEKSDVKNKAAAPLYRRTSLKVLLQIHRPFSRYFHIWEVLNFQSRTFTVAAQGDYQVLIIANNVPD